MSVSVSVSVQHLHVVCIRLHCALCTVQRSEMQMAKGIHSVIVRGGISVGDGEVHTEFTIDCSHPLISVISMIAPSPDWIVGVHDLRLCRHDGWMKEYHAILPGYDCGTDSGECYTCPDAPEDPHQMMRELTKKTITNRDSSFYDPNGGFISPFGTLWLKLLNVTGGCPTTEGPGSVFLPLQPVTTKRLI